MTTGCRPAVLCTGQWRVKMTLINTEQGSKSESASLKGGSHGDEVKSGAEEMQAGSWRTRTVELELENLRLARLVGDLLLKNQRLRATN